MYELRILSSMGMLLVFFMHVAIQVIYCLHFDTLHGMFVVC